MNSNLVSIINVSGKDAEEFLQDNITNNIANNNIYALLLNPLGKYLFDCFISRHQNEFLIELPFQDPGQFINHLNTKKLRRKINITCCNHKYEFLYSDKPLKNSIISYKDPRLDKLGYRNIILKDSVIKSNIDNYIKDKYEYAIPDALDLTPNKSFPLEFHLDKLNAFSFNKGCYTGQEVISRTRTQGEIRKLVVKIIADQNIEELSKKEVKENNKKIFDLTSTRKNLGIAIIRKEYIKNIENITLENIKLNMDKVIW
jgi:tRNA-modifying protein YgfZ